MGNLSLSIVQSPAALAGKAERLNWLQGQFEMDDLAGSDLVVLPELFQSGYNVGPQLTADAEPSDGPFAKEIAKLCEKHNLAIHYGFPEASEGALFNSSQTIGPKGAVLSKHRKLVLPPSFEPEYFKPATDYHLFEFGDFTIGSLICYDVEFPENTRTLAALGADLILCPTALGKDWEFVAHKLVPTRAFENGVFLAYANHAGQESGLTYLGASAIVSPFGQDLARAGNGPMVINATLEKASVAKAQTRLPYLKDLATLPVGP